MHCIALASKLTSRGCLALAGTHGMHFYKRETLTNTYICHCINLETRSGRAQRIAKEGVSVSGSTILDGNLFIRLAVNCGYMVG